LRQCSVFNFKDLGVVEKDEDIKLPQNIRIRSPTDTASYPRRTASYFHRLFVGEALIILILSKAILPPTLEIKFAEQETCLKF
jgi:hypothetical protein